MVLELSRFENVCLFITSRNSIVPRHFKRPVIPTLSMDSACDIFYNIYDNGGRSDIINDLLRQLDLHPLSITLLATAASHNMWDYDRLSREWDTHRVQLLRTNHDESLAATIKHSLTGSLTPCEVGPNARDPSGAIALLPQGTSENSLESIEKEHFYFPGHFACSQASLTINVAIDDSARVRTEVDSVHPTGSTNQSADPPVTAAAGLGILPPTNEDPIWALQPSAIYPTPDPSTIVNLEASVCRRLISRAFSPHELIPLIEEIFTRKDEVNMIGCLDRDAAQTFIDVVHEVRPVVLNLCGAG